MFARFWVRHLYSLCVLGFIATLITTSSRADEQEHLVMGNPSNANQDKDNFLMRKQYFAPSYNSLKGTPNWVSWHLTSDTIGEQHHSPQFRADEELPEGMKIVSPTWYSHSGFDRGHMCPHGDRNRTPEMNVTTFIMTNVVPQTHPLNANAWDGFEMYCRSLVHEGKEYIFAVPLVKGGMALTDS